MEKKKEVRQLTKLVKVRKVLSEGYLGKLLCTTYEGERLVIARGKMTDTELKECTKEWTFMTTDSLSGGYTYVKHVLCTPQMFELLVKDKHDFKQALNQNKTANGV